MSRSTWSKEIVLSHILDLHRRGERLNSYHVQVNYPKLYQAAFKYFGSWGNAVTVAGINYAEVRRRTPMRSWTIIAIVNKIIRRSAAGLSIAAKTVYREDRKLYAAAARHLGKQGWSRARMLAGFTPVDPLPWKIWTREKILAEIRRLYLLEADLNAAAIHSSLYSAAKREFGSWPKAIRAAGLKYTDVRKATRAKGWWTKPRIIMCIRSLEKRGVRLSSKVEQFGSWSEAVEASGISYRQHCRVWSTKAWLRRMESGEYEAVLASAQTHARKRSHR